MEEDDLERIVGPLSQDVSFVIDNVRERGFSDVKVEYDDYNELLLRKEFRDLVVGEIYEAFFLPERHEFEWQIVNEIVGIMTNERIRDFVATAVVAGVLGNAAFAALRNIVTRILKQMEALQLPPNRQEPFLSIRTATTQIEEFFRSQGCARIAAIESSTNVPREQLYPLLKLLGFKHHRRKYNCHWCAPGSIPPAAE